MTTLASAARDAVGRLERVPGSAVLLTRLALKMREALTGTRLEGVWEYQVHTALRAAAQHWGLRADRTWVYGAEVPERDQARGAYLSWVEGRERVRVNGDQIEVTASHTDYRHHS